MSYKGELDICIHCGVMMPEHNFEHLARDCFPQQIDKLNDEVDELTAERDRLQAELTRQQMLRAVDEVELSHLKDDNERLRGTAKVPMICPHCGKSFGCLTCSRKAVENDRMRKALELIKNISGVGSDFARALSQIKGIALAALKPHENKQEGEE